MRINKSGFTIVELIVVIVVIAILATLTFVSYNGVQAKTRDDRRVTDVSTIEKAMELYYSDNGSYPVPTGATGSIINPAWYSSQDSSWSMLENLLVGSQAIDDSALPVDPTNTSISVLNSTGYGYAVFVNPGGYCGAAKGQMYLIVYHLENMPKQRKSDGSCNTSPLGDTYYDNYGSSYYRNVKGVS